MKVVKTKSLSWIILRNVASIRMRTRKLMDETIVIFGGPRMIEILEVESRLRRHLNPKRRL